MTDRQRGQRQDGDDGRGGSPQGGSARERGQSRSGDGGTGRPGSEIPVLEWLMAVIGALLVIGSVGFMLYGAVVGDDSPPNIAIRVDSIRPMQDGYLVQIRTTNRGGSTAAGLTVEGELKGDTGTIETSGTTVDFVPPHSERYGGLFFTQDPRRYTLELRAKGYQEP